jgi:hypothetical protein
MAIPPIHRALNSNMSTTALYNLPGGIAMVKPALHLLAQYAIPRDNETSLEKGLRYFAVGLQALIQNIDELVASKIKPVLDYEELFELWNDSVLKEFRVRLWKH